MFPESSKPQSERQASVSVVTSMSKSNYLATGDSKHECGKRYCNYCNRKQPLCHYYYVAALKPIKLSDKYMYVFLDTECKEDLEKGDGFLSIFQTSYVLSRWVLNVLP